MSAREGGKEQSFFRSIHLLDTTLIIVYNEKTIIGHKKKTINLILICVVKTLFTYIRIIGGNYVRKLFIDEDEDEDSIVFFFSLATFSAISTLYAPQNLSHYI